MDIIDLRSDTTTQPTDAMRRAMAEAPVGDDVYGEDPSVARLEAEVAERLGKESALFFPSGTMANQASVKLWSRPGDVVIGPRGCHLLRYESGAAAAIAGVQIQEVGAGGRYGADDVRAVLPPPDPHFGPVRLVTVENTHNDAGGRIFPRENLDGLRDLASTLDLRLHLDGARLWNVAVASGVPEEEWARGFDTVSVCLSKGLGAPAGSVVATHREARPELLRIRKQLGGAMRQVGILAAAGLHALTHHRDRLAEDHENADHLADGLARLGLRIECEPETNILMFHSERAPELWKAAWGAGVRFNPPDGSRLRAVTHLDVDRAAVDLALERIAKVAADAVA